MTSSSRKSTRPAATARSHLSITGLLYCLGVLLFGAILSLAQQPPLSLDRLPGADSMRPGDSEDASAEAQLPNQIRLREGTKQIDQVGYFKITGDRVTFFAEDGMNRYVGLENLNLQRIHQSVAKKPGQLWNVSGMFTEYFGVNYLFVERAVLVAETDVFSKSAATNP